MEKTLKAYQSRECCNLSLHLPQTEEHHKEAEKASVVFIACDPPTLIPCLSSSDLRPHGLAKSKEENIIFKNRIIYISFLT